MTVTEQDQASAQSPHERLGSFAHILMSAASVVHDAAAYYLKARNSELAGQIESSRHEAAALVFRAYHLGRFHADYQVPIPDDVVAAAAQLLPETADEVAHVNAANAPAPVPDAAPAAAAPVDELEHQGDEAAAAAASDDVVAAAAPALEDQGEVPARVDEPDEPGELEHQGAGL